MTREEFLNEWNESPESWASMADPSDIEEPSEAKIRQGWAIEAPSHAHFNWHMNRCDRRIRDLEARIAWLEKCLDARITESSK